MKFPTLLSLIIPTHNSENTSKNLLNSLQKSNFKNFRQIEVIIVDDYSNDNTLKELKKIKSELKFKTSIFSVKKHIGPAKARNIGAQKAKGKFLLFLDSDVELQPSALKYAFQEAKRAKFLAFTGIWDWHQKTRAFFPQFKALRDWSYWFVERERGARYYLFSTRVAGIEKKLFKKLGGFSEKYKDPTVEDIELTYRIEEQNNRIRFCPKIIVNHEFEGFFAVAIKYFKRSRDWIQLFPKRQKFDPVATSKREALKPVFLGLFFIGLGSYLFRQNLLFLIVSVVFFLFFIAVELKFLIFLAKKKGWLFVIQSIPIVIVLYIIIGLGSAYGLLLYAVDSLNQGKKWRLKK